MKKTINREEWLKERKKGIGASEASCIIGVNPWKTNVELWQEKTGQREPEDIGKKAEVMYGKKAEELVRGLFELAPIPFLRSLSHSSRFIVFFICTLCNA